MWSAAGTALARGAGGFHAQNPLDLAELGIDILKCRCPLKDDVGTNRVADGHFVDEAAEIPLQLSHARGQLIPACAQVGCPLTVHGLARHTSVARATPTLAQALDLGQQAHRHSPKKLPVNLPPAQPFAPLSHLLPTFTTGGGSFTPFF